jgi:hypothetical protein
MLSGSVCACVSRNASRALARNTLYAYALRQGEVVTAGDVLCDPANPIALARRVRAQVRVRVTCMCARVISLSHTARRCSRSCRARSR